MVIYLLLFQTTLRNGNGMKKGKGEMELKRCKKLEPLSQILKQGEMELKRCKKLEPLSH